MKEILMQIIPIVLATVGTFLIGLIKAKYSQYVNTDTKKEIAMLTVRYVEQVFTALHGKDKLEKAKIAFVNVMNEKGIKISESEIDILLEAAVNLMNDKKGADN